jgi:AbrB family transcriptional regulator (stage V sporulation protein T)
MLNGDYISMERTGIVRRIDDLGRIVVPKEIRRSLRIREGDPLEIFASRDGEILLKKYSPIGELSGFASSCAQALSQVVEGLVCITDREHIIAAAGNGRKEVEGEQISETVERLMERRGTFVTAAAEKELPLTAGDWADGSRGAALSSILCNGDCQGAVILLEKNGDRETVNTLKILAAAAAGFIGRNMEQ